MHHLATCSEIIDSFWSEIERIMHKTDIEYAKTDVFKIWGLIDEENTTCPEGACILAIAWRCLYAAITEARIDETPINLTKALIRTIALIHSRVTAYGEKWKLWYNKQRCRTKSLTIAERYKHFKLIEVEDDATYTINPELEKLWKEHTNTD